MDCLLLTYVMGLKIDEQRSQNQMMYDVVVGRCDTIQILIKVSPFGPEVLVESPAEACKHAVLTKAGWIDSGR
jgi:hypothetical protein